MRPDGPRDPVAGPENGPEPPFPIKLRGPVIRGFGRGSRELGIPTANIPPSGLTAYPDLPSGVYYGYIGLLPPDTDTTQPNTTNSSTHPTSPQPTTTTSPQPTTPQPSTYPAVLSIGYNPFYRNKTRSIEIHILHTFASDFYGAALNLLVLGFIRPEYDYVSRESLIEDIKTDCEVAGRSLERVGYASFQGEGWLGEFGWIGEMDVGEVEREVLGQT